MFPTSAVVTVCGIAAVAGAMLTSWSLIARPALADAQPVVVPAQASQDPVFLPACGGTAEEQPLTIVSWCASGDGYWGNLQWNAWGGSTAQATGQEFRNSCDCASGRILVYPVRITLGGRTASDGIDRYTTLTVVYPAKRPASRGTESFRWTPQGYQ